VSARKDLTFRAGDPAGLQFELVLHDQVQEARADMATFGRLTAWLGEDLVWGRLGSGGNVLGVEWYWVELLEHLAWNWRYLRYEPGYPFRVAPVKPSGLPQELERRWSQPGMDPAAEEETLYAFRSSHNLAYALHGCVASDLWFVREGRVAIVEANNDVRRRPLEVELSTLTALGDYLCERIAGLSDTRSVEARIAWNGRDEMGFEDAVPLLTNEAPDRLAELAGDRAFDDVFKDPLSPRFDDNRALDLIYRCKGLAPAWTMRRLLQHLPRDTGYRNTLLDDLSRRLRDELESLIDRIPPYKQGQKLALMLRHDRDLFPDRCGRAEPERLLRELDVAIERWPFDSELLDAVAVWGHSTKPWVVLNVHEKHVANIGAERATTAHELCHLLIDREDVLPLTAVVGGAMDRTAEQRANAFAAEFLCPRFGLRLRFEQCMVARQVINEATDHFGVSRELAALQLARADCELSLNDQREIDTHVAADAYLPWNSY